MSEGTSILYRAARLWHRLTESRVEFNDPARRRGSKLLASVLVVLIAVGLSSGVLQLVFVAGFLTRFLIILAAISILGLTYLANRAGHHHAAAFATALVPVLASAGIAVANPQDPAWFAFSALSVLLASAFFAWPTVLAIAAIAILAIAVVCWSLPGVGESAPVALPFNVIVAGLVVVVGRHRQLAEKDRQAALRESEQKYRALFENSPVGVGVADRNGELLAYNAAMMQPGGYERADVESYNVAMFYFDEEERQQVLERFATHGRVVQHAVRMRRKDGTPYHTSLSLAPITFGGKPAVMAIVEDVTEQKSAQQALEQQVTLNRQIQEATSDGYVLTDLSGRILEVNPAFCRMIGYGESELLQRNIRDVEGACEEAPSTSRLGAMTHDDHTRFEVHHRRPDGAELVLDVSTSATRKGEEPVVAAFVRDVSERVQAERALRKSHRELRDLATRLEEVREEERTSIAREIHDELGPTLTALKLDFNWLVAQLPEGDPRHVERAKAATAVIERGLHRLRNLISRLRPAVLDELGLLAAIDWQAEETEKRSDVRFKLNLDPSVEGIDRKRATALFRIFQEACTNILRHARATHAHVQLSRTQDQVELVVSDNGRGISDAAVTDPHSYGLIGIRERARSLEGTVDVSRRPGGGTELVVRLPWTPETQGCDAAAVPVESPASPD